MMASWMVYLAAVSLLLGVAALGLERVLGRRGLPTRWPWVVSLMGSMIVPAGAWVRGSTGWAGGGLAVVVGDPVPVVGAAVTGVGEAAARWGSVGAGIDGPLGALWVAGSGAMLLALAGSIVGLRRRRRAWVRGEVEGREVLVSDGVGPAVIGFRRLEIVLPRWVLEMEPGQRRLLVHHEEEHVRARDPHLLFLAAVPLVAMPWSPAVWWQAKRLRDAIEIDCDRRVLEAIPATRTYGELLLAFGARMRLSPLPLPGFAGGITQLERRILMIAMPTRSQRRPVAAAVAAASLLLGLAACAIQPPIGSAAVDTATPGAAGGGVAALPTPALDLSTEESRIEPVQSRALDPLTSRGSQTPVIGSDTPNAAPAPAAPLPRPGSRRAPSRAPAPAHPAAPTIAPSGAPAPAAPGTPAASGVRGPASDTIPQPTFTPFDERPTLVNRADFATALDAAFPQHLRQPGLEAMTVLWVRIDETGSVTTAQVVQSSGHPELDLVATDLMESVARFDPATNDDRPVAVWVQIPVRFAS